MGSDSEQEIDFFFLKKKRRDIISWLSKSLKKRAEIEFSFVVNQLYFQRQSLLKILQLRKETRRYLWKTSGAKVKLFFY